MYGTFYDLRVSQLTPEAHERTCNYWYTVTDKCTAHTAFETREALDGWLDVVGLKLSDPLCSGGDSTIAKGKLRYVLHMDRSVFDAIVGREFVGLDNGRYTKFKACRDGDVMVVSCMNVNAPRHEYDYRTCRNRVNCGNYAVDGLLDINEGARA